MARYQFNPHFEQNFVAVCRSSKSMAQAAQTLGMNYKTLRFHAMRLGCFNTNQPGYQLSKRGEVVKLQDIFDGVHQTYQSHKLKKRLIGEGLKRHECENCALSNWLNLPIPLELHHVDGNRYNNSLQNLQLLCPNCHALTDNYRARNIKNLSAPAEMRDVEPLNVGEASITR